AAVHGATVLFVPVSSAVEAVGAEFDNPGGWEVNLRFYAMTYGLPVVMANRVGREEDLTFWGGSRVLDPFGRTLARAEGGGEQLITAELDYEAVRRARYLLPTVRDSDLALILREAERLAGIVGVPDLVRSP
ncbi:MAG TPA: nitrilase-related carbon-nitrogen hydrolase, partial [Geminicoccaceae bacterium]|nr:nitrilase-related carbon-nitrogen hydrolase [Geminicoccaceae bacterium]